MRAAATGDGLLVPMGFEFAAERDMSRHAGHPDDLADTQAPCTRPSPPISKTPTRSRGG